MIASLKNLNNIFGDETITETDIINMIAAQPKSERLKLLLQVLSLNEYTAEENKVPNKTDGPHFYHNFSNPNGIMKEIIPQLVTTCNPVYFE